MADAIRTLTYLQNVLRDGQAAGSIVPQHVRDFLFSVMSVAAGISAAGTNQGTATVLTARWNIVSTVTAGTGVILPAGVPAVVSNRGTNPLLVYPPTSAKIEALSINAAFTLAPGQDLWTAPHPSDATQVYAVSALNLANLSTSLPAAPGVPWNNGGVISIS